MRPLFLVALVLTCAAGCAAPIARVPFPVEEYARLNTEGVAVVKGQAFLKTRGGDVKTAAGNAVVLNPVTAYSQQWYDVSYLQQRPLEEPDPRQNPHILETVADADGRFTFPSVPAGDYFLVASVVWEASRTLQGGYVVKRITVTDGDALDIVLTR